MKFAATTRSLPRCCWALPHQRMPPVRADADRFAVILRQGRDGPVLAGRLAG